MGKGGSHKLYSFFHKSYEQLDNVYVHDFKDASVIYASHMLIKINKINDYKLRLQNLINFFDNELTEPITTGLTKAEVLSTFKLMQTKYKVFDIITCKNDLEVFLFNNSHKNYNSLCEVFYEPNKPGTYFNRFILLKS